jgi:hypothetical protein
MTEKSITSNITTIKIQTEIEPKIGSNARYEIKLGNPIYSEGVPERVVTSTGFFVPNNTNKHFLRDDGLGNIVMYYEEGSSEVIVNNRIGSVDYSTGTVIISNLNIASIDGQAFVFTFKPESYDVVAVRNSVLDIPTTLISVSAIVDSAGSRYQFTSSRS